MRKVPKASPRYKAALARTKATKEANVLSTAYEQLEKENKIRAIVGKRAQRLGGK